MVYVLLDDECVECSSLFEIVIDIHEVSRLVIKIESLVLFRYSILNSPFGYFCGGTLHNFLEVCCSDIIDDPFNLESADIDPGGHCKKVHYLIGHHLHVLVWLLYHHLKIDLFNCHQISIALIVFINPTQENHHVEFGSMVHVDIKLFVVVIVFGIDDTFRLLFVFDVRLNEESVLLQFGAIVNVEVFKLYLVHKLLIAIFVHDQTERLLFVHFMLLQGCDLVVVIIVQHITLEVMLVFLENNRLHPCVERRWYYLVVIFHMHE